jgi:hypothetical protein
MSRAKKQFIPSYRLHKPSGQGIVEIKGRRFYLGPYNKPDTRAKYRQLIAEWLANGKKLPVSPENVTVVELCNAYWKWCRGTYALPDGSLSSTEYRARTAIRALQSV